MFTLLRASRPLPPFLFTSNLTAQMIEIHTFRIVNGPHRGKRVTLEHDGFSEQYNANTGLYFEPGEIYGTLPDGSMSVREPDFFWVDLPNRRLIYIGHYVNCSCPKN